MILSCNQESDEFWTGSYKCFNCNHVGTLSRIHRPFIGKEDCHEAYIAELSSIATTSNQDKLRQLTRRNDIWIRHAIASNPHVPADILSHFSCSSDDLICRLVARHPNTPSIILQVLVAHDDPDIRRSVACNPQAGSRILLKLANDPDCRVRYLITQHPNASDFVLSELSKNNDDEIRLAVARNIQTPLSVLIRLTKDRNQDVRRSARSNSRTPTRYQAKPDVEELYFEQAEKVFDNINANKISMDQFLSRLKERHPDLYICIASDGSVDPEEMAYYLRINAEKSILKSVQDLLEMV